MHTCSSPSNSEEDHVVELETGKKNRCEWSKQDEIDLIHFLIENKDKAGDSATFKSAMWNAASRHLEKTCTGGGPKTSKACTDKLS